MSEFDDTTPGQEANIQNPQGAETGFTPQVQTLTERASEILARQKEAEGNIDSEQMLRFMDELEVAREVFDRNLAIIGKGEDRTLLFQVPQQGYLEEPVVFSVYTGKPYQPKVDMPAGTETTITDERLTVNRGGFEKVVTIDRQRVNFDPSSPFFNSEFEWDRKTLPEMESWATGGSIDVERRGKEARDRLARIIESGDYSAEPDRSGVPYAGSDRSKIIAEVREQEEMYIMGKEIGPDKLFTNKGNDVSFEQPGERGEKRRNPPRKQMFDFLLNYGAGVVKVTKPEFVGEVLKANMVKPNLNPPSPTANTV